MLYTFPTVTEAIKCAIDIQEKTHQIENLNLRIGIHEGEVSLKDGDVQDLSGAAINVFMIVSQE